MRFTVPQFIDMETKIIWILSWRQLLFVLSAIALDLMLYFNLAKKNFSLFASLAVIILLVAFALAFVKVNGRNLPAFLLNLLRFSSSPKVFIWQKKKLAVGAFKEEKMVKKEGSRDQLPLQTTRESQINKLKTRVDTAQDKN